MRSGGAVLRLILTFALLILLVFPAISIAQTATTPPPIVSGRVVDAGSGRPIPGAVVTPAGDATVDPIRPILTNANGEFVVRGLRHGSLVLTATKGGYVDATYGQRRPAGSTQPIPLTDGARYNKLEIRMWRHGVITGSVIDESGDPLVGVRVQSFQRGLVAGRRTYAASRTGVTDDRGVYRIASLTPADYVVAVLNRQTAIPTEVMDVFFAGRAGSTDAQRVELGAELNRLGTAVVPVGSEHAIGVGAVTMPLEPGTATPTSRPNGDLLIYPTTFYPAATAIAQAASIVIRSGEERSSIDLQLQPVRSRRVSGSLIAPDGMASHVGIRLLQAGSDAAADDMDTAVAMSDASGAFTLVGVPPGQYVLSVVRVPRPPPDVGNANRLTVTAGSVSVSPAPPPGPSSPAPISADATLWARVPLAVGDEDLSNVIVPLRAGPRMSGHVEFDGAGQRPDGPSIANLRITLDPADGSQLGPDLSFQTGRPDESGEFTTFGVPPGRYIVNVARIMFPGWVFKEAQYQGHDISDLPIELQSSDVSGVVITFTDRPATLSGVVRNGVEPDGEAVVFAYPVDSSAWALSGARPRRMRTARAAKDGTYSLSNLTAGEYYIVAIREDNLGDWQDPSLLQSLTRLAQQIRLVDGQQMSQDLRTVTIR